MKNPRLGRGIFIFVVAFPLRGEGGPKGWMRVGLDGAVVIERADTEVRPYKSSACQ